MQLTLDIIDFLMAYFVKAIFVSKFVRPLHIDLDISEG
jgi:hypothetical protein